MPVTLHIGIKEQLQFLLPVRAFNKYESRDIDFVDDTSYVLSSLSDRIAPPRPSDFDIIRLESRRISNE